jgi:hypothetical protein
MPPRGGLAFSLSGLMLHCYAAGDDRLFQAAALMRRTVGRPSFEVIAGR